MGIPMQPMPRDDILQHSRGMSWAVRRARNARRSLRIQRWLVIFGAGLVAGYAVGGVVFSILSAVLK
jgi:uncharacterized oligopeptide transporter (OPT) family protein